MHRTAFPAHLYAPGVLLQNPLDFMMLLITEADVKQKPWGIEFFSEIKNVMGHILVRRRTGSWDTHSEQPEKKIIYAILKLMEHFCTMSVERKM